MKKTIISAFVISVAMLSSAVMSGQTSSRVFSTVVTPELPEKVTLCGETIDLDRADKYEAFDRELTSIAYTHGSTLLIIKRANRFFPELAPILKANGVPDDLLYLCCVESSLNPRAYSGAKAAGLWQFIESAAKEYGLEVNSEVDERYNLEKATVAACKFLKQAKARYGNWPSAMAAYNGGQTRIARALDKQDAETSLDLYLAEETMRYPYRVAAMKTILENPRAYGFALKDNQLYQPREYRTVKVSGPVPSWTEWAVGQGITYAELRDANPWIRDFKLTNKAGKTYTVKIPVRKSLNRSTAGTKTYNPKWTVQ